MEDIKKEGWVIGVMAIVFVVINRINQNSEINRVFIFTNPDTTWKYYVATAAALLVSFLFFCIVFFMIFEAGHWHHPKSMEFIRYFIVYFMIQLIILLCIWPGNFKQDEIYLTQYAISGMSVFWYQSFISQAFYIICLMIFPYIVSITFFQIFVISLLAAATMQKAAMILKHKKAVWCLLFPFLLFPVLDSNQFPLRNSIISWIFLYIVVFIYTETKTRGYMGDKKACIFLFAAVFIGAWKTEFLYLVPVLFIFFLALKKCDYIKISVKMILVIGISYFILTIPDHFFRPQDNYILTSILTPLSDILVEHHEDHGEALEYEFEYCERWLPVDSLKNDPYFGRNTPRAFMTMPSLSSEQRREFMKASVKICLSYKGDFIRNRWNEYVRTNGMIPNVYNHGRANQLKIDGKDLYNAYFKYTQLGDPKVRSAVISFFACRENGKYDQTTFLYPIMYNSSWGIILLALFGIVFLIRKKPIQAFICALILCQPILVFILAPAPFFMYYMPFYLTSYTMVILFVTEWLDARYIQKHLAAETGDEDKNTDLSEHTEEKHAAE